MSGAVCQKSYQGKKSYNGHDDDDLRQLCIYVCWCDAHFCSPLPSPQFLTFTQAGEVIWEYKEDTEILRTYHKKDIDSETDLEARENIVTYSYMLDDDVFGSTPTPEEDTSYYFNHSCAPNCWYQVREMCVCTCLY